MPAMTKRVNVRTVVAVRTVNPPISGTYNNVIMTTSDILKCLCRRAHVEEILPNGKTVKLNMHNYYLDNGAGLDARKPKVEEKKDETPAKEKKSNSSKKTVEKKAADAGVVINAVLVEPPVDEEEEVQAPAVPEVVEEKQPEEQVVETTESVNVTEEDVETPVVEDTTMPYATSGYLEVVELDENGNPIPKENPTVEELEAITTVAVTEEKSTPAKKKSNSSKKKK